MVPFSGAFWVLYFTVQVPAVVYTHNLPIYRYVNNHNLTVIQGVAERTWRIRSVSVTDQNNT